MKYGGLGRGCGGGGRIRLVSDPILKRLLGLLSHRYQAVIGPPLHI